MSADSSSEVRPGAERASFSELEAYARTRVTELRAVVNSGTCTGEEEREAAGMLGLVRALDDLDQRLA